VSAVIFPNVWARNGLFAFSGLDGNTDYYRPFVGSLLPDQVGVYLHVNPPCVLRWPDSPQVLDRRRSVVAGDCLVLYREGEERPFLTCAFLDQYTLVGRGAAPELTSAAPVRSFVPDPAGTVVVRAQGDRFACAFGETQEDAARAADEALAESPEEVVEARLAVLRGLPQPPFEDDARRGAYYKAFSILKCNTYSPQGDITVRWTTPDRWPHRHMWLWDSAFHALGLSRLSGRLAQESLEAVLSRQQPDGFIPHVMAPGAGRLSDLTQPPVLAWACWRTYRLCADRPFLEWAYPRLSAYLGWDLEYRDADGDGLLEWRKDEESVLCHCGESGMDNSPRFDRPGLQPAVDFNAMFSAECAAMARIAAVLGRGEDAFAWLSLRESHRRLMEAWLWSSDHGLYLDRIGSDWVEVPTVASFTPLYARVPGEERAARLVESLRDPERFWRALPVPSVAADHPEYSDDMWRGPTWLNLNYLVAEGLLQYGHRDLALELAERTVGEVARWYEREGCLFEYYDPEGVRSPASLSRKRNTGIGVIRDYGWSAAMYIEFCHLLNDPEGFEAIL
jgi:glycogen debranching enzyme